MSRSPNITSITHNQGKTIVVIPKPIAEAMNVKVGEKIHWRIMGKGRVELMWRAQ